MRLINSNEMLELIKKISENEGYDYIYEDDAIFYVSNEWLVGCFAGRVFCGNTIEQAINELIAYLKKESEFDTIVGRIINNAIKDGKINLCAAE